MLKDVSNAKYAIVGYIKKWKTANHAGLRNRSLVIYINFKIMKSKARKVVEQYQWLRKKAKQFVFIKTGVLDCRVRIDTDNDCIDYEHNTACNCHPKYSWKLAGTCKEFEKWLARQVS